MEKLFQKFYKDLKIILTIFLASSLVVIAGFVLALLSFLLADGKIYLALFFGILLLVLAFWALVVLKPFLKDLKEVKKGQCTTLSGTVVHYRRDMAGKDTSTALYYPVVKPDFGSEEIELCVEGTELHKHYTFYCLKHTRLAVIDESAEEPDNQTETEETK